MKPCYFSLYFVKAQITSPYKGNTERDYAEDGSGKIIALADA